VEWKETNDPHEAVVHGLASTARVITSAAMIVVSVFLAFVINGDPTVKQFGLGMAVAVAVDATVVRCVLVPAIMSLLASVGWWLPKWMERATPKFSIEGNEWFAEHETPAPARKRATTESRKALQTRPRRLTDARKSRILVGRFVKRPMRKPWLQTSVFLCTSVILSLFGLAAFVPRAHTKALPYTSFPRKRVSTAAGAPPTPSRSTGLRCSSVPVAFRILV
jgi:multidrug efflux pump subunit AcrB